MDQSGFRTEQVAAHRSRSISAGPSRSRDDERSVTPPSSPGSSSCSLEVNSDSQAPILRKKRVKKAKRVRRKKEVVVEDAKVRIGRFFLTVTCFAPFYFLWTMRMNDIIDELGGLQFLLYLLPIGCVLLAATRETLNIHSISFLYPVLSFGTGIVGGCYSYKAMKDQQVLRLLAICFHGIIAGRLRTLSESSPKKLDEVNHFGGFVFWLLMGEVCCMLYRNFLQELSAAAVAYGLVTVVPLIAAAAPAIIISTWCKCVGVERPSSTNTNASIISRCYEAVAWVISAFTPLIIAGSTFLWTLYVMLPMVWERMLFVAPWGVLLEIGSVVSCGYVFFSFFFFLLSFKITYRSIKLSNENRKGAKSLFYLESPLDRRRLNHAAAVFVGDR